MTTRCHSDSALSQRLTGEGMTWPANEILELTVGYRANGQQCLLVTHWMAAVAPPGPGLTELEIQDRIVEQQKLGGNGTLTGELTRILCAQVSINFARAQGIWPTRWRRSLETFAMPGARPGICNAQNLQASVEKSGDKGLRNNIGAMRIGGVSTTDTVNGLVTPDYLTALTTFQDAYLNNLGQLYPDPLVQWFPVILNKKKIIGSDPPKYEISGTTPVHAVSHTNTLRTMSRRTIGRGE